MKRSILCIFTICLLMLPAQICCHLALPTPIVGIKLSETGMHRDLLYTVQFDYPLAGKDCEYMLEQPLPAAVYVSVDQLDDLKRLKKLNAIYPKFVDIEIPAEKAHGLTVLLKGTPKPTESFKLPIHFRYHAASDSSTFVTVDISNPTMYIKCPAHDGDSLDNEPHTSDSAGYCLNEQNCNFVLHSSELELRDCDWKLIDADYQLKSELRAKIPVGNEKAFPPILILTIIASWIVSLWTVFRTHLIPRRINYKLEEQRVLQNKMK